MEVEKGMRSKYLEATATKAKKQEDIAKAMQEQVEAVALQARQLDKVREQCR